MSLSCWEASSLTCLPPTLLRKPLNHAPQRSRGPLSHTTSTRPLSEGVGGGAHIGCSPTASILGCVSLKAAAAGAFKDVTSIHSGTCLCGSSSAAYSRITAGVTDIGTENTTTSHLETRTFLAASSSPASTPTTSTSGYSDAKKRVSHRPKSPAAPTTPMAVGVTDTPASAPEADIAVGPFSRHTCCRAPTQQGLARVLAKSTLSLNKSQICHKVVITCPRNNCTTFQSRSRPSGSCAIGRSLL
eukprot:m.448893 g.448893  ORF g.448893 m.448893 type:complete len:244 (+) comp19733_c0_seq1:721-1452(+)